MSELARGETVGGRYDVVREIGRGGMQIVYLANDNVLQRHVVLKAPKDTRAARRFHDSAVLSATVNHPNVARTLDYIEYDDRFYLIEEYVHGEDLKKVASRFVRLDAHTAAYVLHHLVRAVAASHRVDVVHRDLKPSNIMVAGGLAFAGLKVTDFGIAKMAEHEVGEHVGGDDDTTAQSSTVMNALAYIAPEVLNAPHDVRKAADVWAVSAIAWELLTGKPPFGSGLQAVTRILDGPAPTLGPALARHPQFGSLASELAALLLTGMDRAVGKRPSAAQLAQSCDRLCYLPPTRELGTVQRYPRDTWGFIQAAAGDDVFFHVQSVVGARPQLGTTVWFTRFKGAPSPRAIPVVPLVS